MSKFRELNKKFQSSKTRIMTWDDWKIKKGNDWNGFKEYLFDNHMLSPNLDFKPTGNKPVQQSLID